MPGIISLQCCVLRMAHQPSNIPVKYLQSPVLPGCRTHCCLLRAVLIPALSDCGKNRGEFFPLGLSLNRTSCLLHKPRTNSSFAISIRSFHACWVHSGTFWPSNGIENSAHSSKGSLGFWNGTSAWEHALCGKETLLGVIGNNFPWFGGEVFVGFFYFLTAN